MRDYTLTDIIGSLIELQAAKSPEFKSTFQAVYSMALSLGNDDGCLALRGAFPECYELFTALERRYEEGEALIEYSEVKNKDQQTGALHD